MRTEADFGQELRSELHNPLRGWVVEKVQDGFKKGQLDYNVCFNGAVAKLELKYVPEWPAMSSTHVGVGRLCSAEQRRHLSEWQQGGGCALVLVGVEDCWFLFQWPNVPLSLPASDMHHPPCVAHGKVNKQLHRVRAHVMAQGMLASVGFQACYDEAMQWGQPTSLI